MIRQANEAEKAGKQSTNRIPNLPFCELKPLTVKSSSFVNLCDWRSGTKKIQIFTGTAEVWLMRLVPARQVDLTEVMEVLNSFESHHEGAHQNAHLSKITRGGNLRKSLDMILF